jgi:hypothetical protein
MTGRRDQLDEALKELRREHLEITAPDRLEGQLRAAARAAQTVAAPRAPLASWWNWRWGFAVAAAAVILALAMWGVGRWTQPQVQQAVVETPSNPAPVEQTQEVAVAEASPTDHDLSPAMIRSAERRRRAEGVTAFMEVPGSEGLPAPMDSSIVRVKMAKGELRQYGIDVPPAATNELVRADLYLGEDGLPRAIRLVR